jgi:formylmethanofuran dehydrogenase subunit A
VPYEYRATDFYNATQWAVGLELFLLIDDPWRVFFTTDHPNGAPFTTYPEIFALLMDRDLRAQQIASLPPDAMAVTTLPAITREYSLNEIAIMTRARRRACSGSTIAAISVRVGRRRGGLCGRARPGKMFRAAALVFKDGELVVRDGAVTPRWGRALSVRPSAIARSTSA